MNELIKKQLSKCTVCSVPEYDDETEIIVIPKFFNKVQLGLNNYYILKLKNNVINPSSNDSIPSNWNKNIVPESQYLICLIKKFINDMVQVDACGWDVDNQCAKNDRYEDYWLKLNSFDVVTQIFY